MSLKGRVSRASPVQTAVRNCTRDEGARRLEQTGVETQREHLMTSPTRRVAGCHLLLRGNRWMPISVNKTLGAEDRCSPAGAVISAFLSAVVEGDTIIGWMKNSAFSVQEVLPDGTLAPLDLTPAKLALQADSADMEASKAGIVGISSLIAGRRIQEQNSGKLPSKLREAAFERATVQILDKLQGHFVVGVRLYRLLIRAHSASDAVRVKQLSVIAPMRAPRGKISCMAARRYFRPFTSG